MATKPNIDKATWNLLQAVKDYIGDKLVDAKKNQKILIDDAQLSQIINLVKIFADEGYNRAYNNFLKSIK